jgi:hypothetical protein
VDDDVVGDGALDVLVNIAGVLCASTDEQQTLAPASLTVPYATTACWRGLDASRLGRVANSA